MLTQLWSQQLAELRLRESEARFRHMADSAPALIWMTDGDGALIFANMHFDYLFGRPAVEMLGSGWKSIVLIDDLAAFEHAFFVAFQARLPFKSELRVLARAGQTRWLRCEGVPRLDDAGGFLGYTGCSVDITDAKAAEAKVSELNATLEARVAAAVAEREQAWDALRQAQKMEAVGQLTGGVAHDFNNLLTIIRSSTELLRRPNLTTERRRRYIDAITETVERASKITGQLLAFARRQTLKPEVFNAAQRAQSVADMLRPLLGSRILIVTDTSCEDCFVEADVSQFETALVNMAVNARDAMQDAGTLTIRVKSVPRVSITASHLAGEEAFVSVSLTDTGCGIAADALQQIFEPFFTTKEVGKGTGLGLAQLYGFAKQSGGDVAVDSELGSGSTFTLYLPRVALQTVAKAAPVEARGTGPIEDGGGRRVLLVEDNAEVGSFLSEMLKDLGYDTTWTANASEALRCLAEGLHVDVVFSDVVMPGISGVELGEELRKRYPRLPVILTSGYSDVLTSENSRGFEFLQKPYATAELSQVLRRVIPAS